MVYAQPSICPGEERNKVHWDFEIKTDSLISVRRPDLMITNKKKRTYRIVDFSVSAGLRVKLKENEKRDTRIIK